MVPPPPFLKQIHLFCVATIQCALGILSPPCKHPHFPSWVPRHTRVLASTGLVCAQAYAGMPKCSDENQSVHFRCVRPVTCCNSRSCQPAAIQSNKHEQFLLRALCPPRESMKTIMLNLESRSADIGECIFHQCTNLFFCAASPAARGRLKMTLVQGADLPFHRKHTNTF